MQPYNNDSPALIQGNQCLFHLIMEEICHYSAQLSPILEQYKNIENAPLTIQDFDDIATLIPKMMWSADALRNFAQMGVFRIVPQDGLSSSDSDKE